MRYAFWSNGIKNPPNEREGAKMAEGEVMVTCNNGAGWWWVNFQRGQVVVGKHAAGPGGGG